MPLEAAPRIFDPICNVRPGSTLLDDSPEPEEEVGKQQSLAVSQSRRLIRPHRKTRQGCFNCKRRKVKVHTPLSGHLFTAPPSLEHHIS